MFGGWFHLVNFYYQQVQTTGVSPTSSPHAYTNHIDAKLMALSSALPNSWPLYIAGVSTVDSGVVDASRSHTLTSAAAPTSSL